MQNGINDVVYGNPNALQLQTIAVENYLNKYYDEFLKTPVPQNLSKITRDELNELAENLKDINAEINQSHKRRYMYADQNLGQFLINNLKPKTINVPNLFIELNRDLDPIILRLKFKFNRPRPSDLAHYLKLKLFPLNMRPIDTPSFPSKTVIISDLLCDIIGNREPELFETSQKVKEDVASGRLYLGVNYKSDLKFSSDISSLILKDKEFAKKYEI